LVGVASADELAVLGSRVIVVKQLAPLSLRIARESMPIADGATVRVEPC
jgi:hypothetical protein